MSEEAIGDYIYTYQQFISADCTIENIILVQCFYCTTLDNKHINML